MKILVTGASGYIGSHTVLELLEAGHDVVGVDNLVNSARESLRRVEALTGRVVPFVQADIRNEVAMRKVLSSGDGAGGAGANKDAVGSADAGGEPAFDAVMHFAGLKAVGESTEKPLAYYENNVGGTLALLRAMDAAGARRLIFSSSATVYGDPASVPIAETAPVGSPANPYGYSKLMIEQILRDLAVADPRWSVGLLRYFNPVGAHPSGQIGEDPQGLPNNLVPYISQVAVGRRPTLSIFGDDYPTPDGTGVRDYIHVVDLARGHLAALEYLMGDAGRCRVWNLGTGRGYSVYEAVAAYERACGQSIPVQVVDRRPGDIAECYADAGRAQQELGWAATHDLDAMMRDAWNWQRQNPQGYEG